MIVAVGGAKFGNVNGSHQLQKHSGIPNEVLRAIQWHTDLPSGPPEAWQPFHAGFPVADNYVVRYTRPDPTAERAGMVSTTVVVAGTDIYRHSLRELLDHSVRESEFEPLQVSTLPSAKLDAPAGLAGVIDALAASGKVVWLGQAGFSEMVAALWDALAPSDRRRLVFGLVWHPGAIPYPIDSASQQLMVFTAPTELRQRFDEWSIVNPLEPPVAGRTASAALRLESGRVSSLASRLGIEHPTLIEWTRLGEAAELWAELDDLTDERLRGFTHLLAALAPDPEHGADLKAAVVVRISEVTTAAGFAHVRGLRTFPRQAYPSALALPQLLSRWAMRVISDSGAIEDLATAVDAASQVPGDAWSHTLATALMDSAGRDPASTRARLTDLVDRDRQETFGWFSDICPAEAETDLHLSTWAASRQTPEWLPEMALQHGWAMTHAVCCSTTDPIGAWRRHAQIAGRSARSDDALASRVGPLGTVRATLALTDPVLLRVAGLLVAHDPALLDPARVADPPWRAVWISAIDAGADPWSVVPAAEAVPQLLDVLMEGGSVSDRLLDAAADSEGADLSGHQSRASVWGHLPSGIRDRFLDRTARALALSTTNELASLEPDLIVAILRPANLEAVAQFKVDRVIDVLEQLDNHVTSEAVLAVTKGAKLPPECSSRLGHLMVSRGLKPAAKKLAKRARNRPDLVPAATAASGLLSIGDRLTFMLRADRVDPTADDVQHLARELTVELYSDGPMDRNLWARSGGDPADLPDAPTARARWDLALEAITARARWAPTLSAVLDVMMEDYDREELRQLRGLL